MSACRQRGVCTIRAFMTRWSATKAFTPLCHFVTSPPQGGRSDPSLLLFRERPVILNSVNWSVIVARRLFIFTSPNLTLFPLSHTSESLPARVAFAFLQYVQVHMVAHVAF